MTDISHNLSGKISPVLVSILRQVEQEVSARGIAFFIVGATARDLVLQHGHNLPVHRGTLDLDIGIDAASWEELQQLKAALIATGRFAETGAPQRLLYGHFLIDIVPPIAPRGIILDLVGFDNLNLTRQRAERLRKIDHPQ